LNLDSKNNCAKQDYVKLLMHRVNSDISIFSSGRSDRSPSTHASISELLLLLRRLQNLEAAHQSVINRHHCPSVIKLSAVVRSAEQGHQLSLCKELVAILYNLMSSADQIYVMFLVKSCHNFLAECETNSSVILSPTLDIFVRI